MVAVGAGSAQAMDLIKADSDNHYSLKAWLHASAVAASVDQDDPFNQLRDETFAFDAELQIRGAYTFENGSQFGAFVELELDNDDSDSVLTDDDDRILDKAYIYYKSIYGHIQFGQVNGAASQMSIAAPSVTRGPRINGGEIYFFEYPFADFEVRPVALRTDLYASGDNIKIVYFTPRKWGLQAGVSYMPDFSRDLGDFFGNDEIDFDQQSEMLEVAANYIGNIGAIDVAVGGSYLKGNNEDPAFHFFIFRDNDDLEEWSFGANIGFGIDRLGVRIGGAYKESNASGGLIFGHTGSGFVSDLIDTTLWQIGSVASLGPWSFGANYLRGESEEDNFLTPSGLSDLNGEAYEIAAGYKVGPGINLNLAFQHYEYDRQPGGFTAILIDGLSDELDTVFLEAALSL